MIFVNIVSCSLESGLEGLVTSLGTNRPRQPVQRDLTEEAVQLG